MLSRCRSQLARFESRVAGWRYTKQDKRDHRLDLLRGFAVFVMVVDHIVGNSWLYAFAGHDRLFVSAAEGFFFISGVTVGMIYGRRMLTNGLRPTVRALFTRAWMLYALAVWLVLASGLLGVTFGHPVLGAFTPEVFFETLTLQRAWPYADVIFLYAYLMLLAPLALVLMRRWGWQSLALLSWGLWALYQVSPTTLEDPWTTAQTGYFPRATWQVLFFTGMIIGYERHRATRRFAFSPTLRNYRWYGTTLIVLSGVIIWVIMLMYGALWIDFEGHRLAKKSLPPWRLAITALVFFLAWETTTRLWRPLVASVGPLLLPLGRGALYAYNAHIPLIAPTFAISLLVQSQLGGDENKVVELSVNMFFQIVILLLVWQLTRKRWLASLLAPLIAPPLSRRRWRAGQYTLYLPSFSLVLLITAAIVAGALATRAVGGSI
jgi:hypothetical protein